MTYAMRENKSKNIFHRTFLKLNRTFFKVGNGRLSAVLSNVAAQKGLLEQKNEANLCITLNKSYTFKPNYQIS